MSYVPLLVIGLASGVVVAFVYSSKVSSFKKTLSSCLTGSLGLFVAMSMSTNAQETILGIFLLLGSNVVTFPLTCLFLGFLRGSLKRQLLQR